LIGNLIICRINNFFDVLWVDKHGIKILPIRLSF